MAASTGAFDSLYLLAQARLQAPAAPHPALLGAAHREDITGRALALAALVSCSPGAQEAAARLVDELTAAGRLENKLALALQRACLHESVSTTVQSRLMSALLSATQPTKTRARLAATATGIRQRRPIGLDDPEVWALMGLPDQMSRLLPSQQP
jgi:hypothetical protein